MFKTEEGTKAGKVISNVTTVWIVGVTILIIILGGALIDWIGFSCLGLAVIIVVLASNAVVIVPTVYFGIATRFKKRIKRGDEVVFLEEGLNIILPLVDDLLPDNIKSRKLTTEEVKAVALSKDKLEVNLEGSVQYRPKNLNTYIEMTPGTIKKGMIDAIESEIGKICGVKDADIFVEKRSEVELLIQSVLQLERPPHHYIDEAGKDKDRQQKFVDNIKLRAKKVKGSIGWKEITDKKITDKKITDSESSEIDEIKEVDKLKIVDGTTKVMGIVLKTNIVEDLKKELGDETIEDLEKKLNDEEDAEKIKGLKEKVERLKELKDLVGKLSPEKWILEKEKEEKEIDIDIVQFYKDNISRISLLFKPPFEEESKVEILYGIKVATFRLAKLSFSKAAQEAFEKVRSAKAEMEAAEKRFGTKVELLQKYIQAGLSPTQAVNLVETTSDVKGVTRQIISVEGSQSADLLAFAKLLAGKGGEK